MSELASKEVNAYYDTGWQDLGNTYLTEEGKCLVDADPDLTDETIAALMETESEFLKMDKKFEFYFDVDRDGSNIGETVLSVLINENPNITFAHLVALYAAIRKYPFITVLLALDPFRKSKGGFKRFKFNPVYGENTVEHWFPVLKRNMRKPGPTLLPGKRRPSRFPN